jgi:hypothetical protein
VNYAIGLCIRESLIGDNFGRSTSFDGIAVPDANGPIELRIPMTLMAANM